ncbi:MAG: FKBP-type peptidyl-prolyl cis-trans isomerase [Oscillospiraceae bacterium]|nr:FKBP-type peptidyl-prolyl cis-trans isomerase [Oscillospiraceae bacterium]
MAKNNNYQTKKAEPKKAEKTETNLEIADAGAKKINDSVVIAVILGAAVLITAIVLAVMTWGNNESIDDDPTGHEVIDDEEDELLKEFPLGVPEQYDNLALRTEYSASNGLDDNGYWIDAKATDVVDFGKWDWRNMEVPYFMDDVINEEVEERIKALFEEFPLERIKVIDREVKKGDVVNIDFVGYVDGVAFDNGSSEGMGAEVVAGGKDFVDDFLDQIIGRKPGDGEFDINVKFPNKYEQNPDLAGKPAVFKTTVNFILEDEDKDVYVKRNFNEAFGWKTEKAYRKGITDIIVRERYEDHMSDYFEKYVTVEIPHNVLLTSVENSIRWHQSVADENDDFGTFSEYLIDALSLNVDEGEEPTIREMVRRLRPGAERRLTNQLIFQAIAEELKLNPTEEDMRGYLDSRGGRKVKIDEAVEVPGMASLKNETIGWMVRNYLIENSVKQDVPPLAD